LTDLGRRLEKRLSRLAPHLEVNVRGQPPDGSWWDDIDLRRPGANLRQRLPHTGVRDSHSSDLDALVEEASRLPGAMRSWSHDSLLTRVLQLVDDVAHQKSSPEVAIDSLLAWSRRVPDAASVLVPIHGVEVDELLASVRLCGVAITARVPEAVMRLTRHRAAGYRELLKRDFGDPYDRDAVAVVRARADDGRLTPIAVARVALALTSLVLTHDIREFTLGFDSTNFGELTVFRRRYTTSERLRMLHPPIYTGQLTVERERRRRPGLRAMHELGLAFGSRPISSLDQDLIRSAEFLSKSFVGPWADRILFRWLALEALLSEPGAEASERLAERVAVLIETDARKRMQVKARVKKLYVDRNIVAHGGSREFERVDIDDLRRLTFNVIEAVAGLRNGPLSQRALLEMVDRAKFEGAVVAVVRTDSERIDQ